MYNLCLLRVAHEKLKNVVAFFIAYVFLFDFFRFHRFLTVYFGFMLRTGRITWKSQSKKIAWLLMIGPSQKLNLFWRSILVPSSTLSDLKRTRWTVIRYGPAILGKLHHESIDMKDTTPSRDTDRDKQKDDRCLFEFPETRHSQAEIVCRRTCIKANNILTRWFWWLLTEWCAQNDVPQWHSVDLELRLRYHSPCLLPRYHHWEHWDPDCWNAAISVSSHEGPAMVVSTHMTVQTSTSTD